MKKRVLFIVGFLIFLSLTVSYSYFNTRDGVTGKSTSSNVAVSISVVVETLSLNITSPKNATYITNYSIPLNYNASGYQVVWYNLDLGTNTTLSENTQFNASDGNHTLYIYANNSAGNLTSKNVSFTVDQSKYSVLYTRYKDKGSSTDFNQTPYEYLQNLSGIILDIPNYGKINFNERINVTNDSNFSDKITDLDTYTNISFNRIEINSTALPNFNKSATIYLYNLTFSNPRILAEGSLCPSSICTKINYSGGTLEFNVTHFTVYSADEAPSASVSGGGGGGSGAAVSSTVNFLVSPNSINVDLKQGETTERAVTVKNTGTSSKRFTIETTSINEFIKLSETEFTLSAGESKEIKIDFIAKESATPDTYVGKLTFKSDTEESDVVLAISINTKQELFDVEVQIPEKYLKVNPGSDLLGTIKIYNLGETGRVDAHLEYIIKNDNNEIILSRTKTVAVETQASFTETFIIPGETYPGKYILYAKVTYGNSVATSGSFFEVIKPSRTLREKILVAIIMALVILIAIIVIIHLREIEKIQGTK